MKRWTKERKQRASEAQRARWARKHAASENVHKVVHHATMPDHERRVKILQNTSVHDAIVMVEKEISGNQRLLHELQDLAKRIVEASEGEVS